MSGKPPAAMPDSIPEALLLVLRELEESELQQFKGELERLISGEAFISSDSDPPSMRPDPEEVLDRLLHSYREQRQALEGAIQLLSGIRRPDLALRLAARFRAWSRFTSLWGIPGTREWRRRPEMIPEALLLVLRELKESELHQFNRELEKLLFGEAFISSNSNPPWMRQGPKEVLDCLLHSYREQRRALEVVIQLLSGIRRPDLAHWLDTRFHVQSSVASLQGIPQVPDEDEDELQIIAQRSNLILPKPPRRDISGAIAESHNLEVEEKKNPEEFEILFSCPRCPKEDHTLNIRPETVLDPERGYNIYRLKCTKRGSFHCCITDFIFDVRAPVTLTYHFDSWTKHLNEEQRKHWFIVGPLLDIQADPEEAVEAIHIPHFLCLKGNSHSKIRIAHFMKDGMSLERPDRVESFHVKLKKPTFSSRGAVLKKQWFKRKIKAHAVALLYQDLRVPILKFHLYLLPNDSSLKKAVHEHELNYDSQRVRKPPETMKALTIGSHFFLEKIVGVAIHPEKLEFKYLSADMEHQYLELFADHMEDALQLSLLEKKKNELVWTAYIRREELHPVKGEEDCGNIWCLKMPTSLRSDAIVPLEKNGQDLTPSDHSTMLHPCNSMPSPPPC